nr:MAG TPA: hypothetical protein [Caudoviricetes sp.]
MLKMEPCNKGFQFKLQMNSKTHLSIEVGRVANRRNLKDKVIKLHQQISSFINYGKCS